MSAETYKNPTLESLTAEYNRPPTCWCSGACGGDPSKCSAFDPKPPFRVWVDGLISFAMRDNWNPDRAEKLRKVLSEMPPD